MNPSVKLVTSSRWLTSSKRREGKSRSSIVIAISDHKLAKKMINREKNHTKTKKTPPTVWNTQNLHTLDSHIILKLSVSTTKLSTLRGENPAYAALSEQEDSDKRKTVPPYKKKKFFTKFSLRLLASLGAKLTCGF